MPAPAVEVDGIRDVRRAFRRATGSTRDLGKAHKKVGKVVELESKRRAKSVGTRQQAKAARALLARGTGTTAELSIRNTKAVPFGLGAFMGGHRPQFPPWVGARWDILQPGQGPYVIGEAIRGELPEILTVFEAEVGAALTAAGLDVTLSTGGGSAAVAS